MKIYLVRHGKDDSNYRGGWSNLPLTDEGIRQSKELANCIINNMDTYKIEKIISSDLFRAKQTAQIANENLNLPIEFSKDLREIDNGYLAGMSNKDAEKYYPGIYYNTLKFDEKYPGGESPQEFYNRITKTFDKIVANNQNLNSILIITHAGVINAIYSYVNNIPWSNKIKGIKVDYAKINIVLNI